VEAVVVGIGKESAIGICREGGFVCSLLAARAFAVCAVAVGRALLVRLALVAHGSPFSGWWWAAGPPSSVTTSCSCCAPSGVSLRWSALDAAAAVSNSTSAERLAPAPSPSSVTLFTVPA
jgi:hypothetical protein